MPSCRITNHTPHTLNISLKQVTALHFENQVQPGMTVKFRPGKVWFTVEALIDDGPDSSSRYSVMKSAATIALISLAAASVAATAGAALLPETAAVAGGATAAALAKGLTSSKALLAAHSGSLVKISGMVMPKAIDRIASKHGGLSALQREVLTVISSPTLSKDLREKATQILERLHEAYSSDKKRSGNPPTSASVEEIKEGEMGENPQIATSVVKENEEGIRVNPGIERINTHVGGGKDGQLSNSRNGDDDEADSLAELKAYERLIEDPPSIATPDQATSSGTSTPLRDLARATKNMFRPSRKGEIEGDVEHGEVHAVERADSLRVHGVYMGDRRHFSVRLVGGKMELFDVMKAEVVR